MAQELGLPDLFPGYHPPTAEQVAAAWKTGVVVLDTNALLDLYKLPKDSREEIQTAYQEVGTRVWAPHQVALEFEIGRERVIAQEWGKVGKLKTKLDEAKKSIHNAIDELHLKRRGVDAEPEKLKEALTAAIDNIAVKFDAAKHTYVDPKADDPVRAFVMQLLLGRVGPPPSSQAVLDALYIEGEMRYALKKPPGFEDKKTDEFLVGGLRYHRKFGDLILWDQVLKHVASLTRNADLIFVTGERKSDWWRETAVGTDIPHPELIAEFKRDGCGGTFLMYSIESFIKTAKQQLATKVSEVALQELMNIQQQEESGGLAWEDRFTFIRGHQTMDIGSWVLRNVNAGLQLNLSSTLPTFVPKFQKSDGGFHVYEMPVDALTTREGFEHLIRDIEHKTAAMGFNGFLRTTFIFKCNDEGAAVTLALRLDGRLKDERCYFYWKGAKGIDGAELCLLQ